MIQTSDWEEELRLDTDVKAATDRLLSLISMILTVGYLSVVTGVAKENILEDKILFNRCIR